MTALHRSIQQDPAFQLLRRRRAVFNWSLALISLGYYYAFICVIAFAPALLAVPLHNGTVITWGIPIGFSVILLSLGLIGIYVVRSNRDFDPAIDEIIARAQQATDGEQTAAVA